MKKSTQCIFSLTKEFHSTVILLRIYQYHGKIFSSVPVATLVISHMLNNFGWLQFLHLNIVKLSLNFYSTVKHVQIEKSYFKDF